MELNSYSRRTLFKAAISAICSPGLLATAGCTDAIAGTEPRHVDNKGRLFISGARHSAEQYVAVVFDEHGTILTTVPLTARAHGAASHHQTNRACLFARRPGMFMNIFDIRTPHIYHSISPVPGRHYYGHGTFSDTGNTLFVTENDFDNARGVVGIYDADNSYQRIGEMASAGIGPHEVVRVPGTSLLAVANGGIQTHPDSGRDKLNIDAMLPSLSIIDSRNGKLVGQHFLPDELHQVSIRHLVCTQDGYVWFAGQYEGTDSLVDGLAGVISIRQSIDSYQRSFSGKGLKLLDLPANLQLNSTNYLSSVAVTGNHVIYTSAKGGLAFKVNRKTLHVEDSVSIFDCSGVAALPYSDPDNPEQILPSAAALITTGTGEIVRMDIRGTTSLAMHHLQWDNHLYQLS